MYNINLKLYTVLQLLFRTLSQSTVNNQLTRLLIIQTDIIRRYNSALMWYFVLHSTKTTLTLMTELPSTSCSANHFATSVRREARIQLYSSGLGLDRPSRYLKIIRCLVLHHSPINMHAANFD